MQITSHKSSLSFSKRAFHFLRRNIWLREPQSIHVEAAYSDLAFTKLLNYVKQHPKVYVMLIDPYDLFHRLRIQAGNVDNAFYQHVMAQHYLLLGKETSNIGVHTHLFMRSCSVHVPSLDEQFSAIKRTKDFLSGLGLPTEDFAAGWNGYNADTIRACELLGFKRFHVFQVWRGIEKSDKLKFVFMWNVVHDFEL